MAIFKCKMCGGNLSIDEGSKVCTCESCGTVQTLSKTDNEITQNLFNRANNLRLKSEFDKAQEIYEKIVASDNTDAEAYWGIVLCKFGIEYVDDPTTHKRVPTCHRTQIESVYSDVDYNAALENALGGQRELYEAEAKEIDRLQKNILRIAGNEKPFDVFLCYKETDSSGKRTQDSVIANDIYHQLVAEGFKVFYAAITLEEKIGQEYEPYIYAALNSAKVMLVIGTTPEYFTAPWVKNEWSRFLKIIKNDRTKLLIPCYRDMDAYDLPEDFSHLQAQDMGKIGFINDIVRGIKKVVQAPVQKAEPKEIVTMAGTATNIAPLLKRAFMFLEDGEFDRADDFCEQVLNQDPECAEAYLGKMMIELHIEKQSDLMNCDEPFDSNRNFQKAMRFADAAFSEKLKKINASIHEKKERKAEEKRKEAVYQKALNGYSSSDIATLQTSIQAFLSIRDWKNAENMAEKCKSKISEIEKLQEQEQIEQDRLAEKQRIADEENRLERERRDEIKRIAREKRKKRSRKIAIIVTPIVACILASILLWKPVIMPNIQYNKAVKLYDSGEYLQAAELLEGISVHDSENLLKQCYKRMNKPQEDRRFYGVCQHCGGYFKGIFNLKCSKCGKPKDY